MILSLCIFAEMIEFDFAIFKIEVYVLKSAQKWNEHQHQTAIRAE